jgi:uncharacterized membrane protein YphA (DoxX/SURF4 family)
VENQRTESEEAVKVTASRDLRNFFATASHVAGTMAMKEKEVRKMNARLPLIGLLAVQIIIGFEWFMSGLTKLVRGDFPSGLADELTEKSDGIGGWYRDFLDNAVIPNATGFGYLIELCELAVGTALIAAALTWLFAWDGIGTGGRTTVLVATALAAFGGIVMNVAFHMANGSAHPWLIPGDGFDEGVDLDSLMPAIQLVLAAVSAGTWLALRRERQVVTPKRVQAVGASPASPATGG